MKYFNDPHLDLPTLTRVIDMLHQKRSQLEQVAKFNFFFESFPCKTRLRT